MKNKLPVNFPFWIKQKKNKKINIEYKDNFFNSKKHFTNKVQITINNKLISKIINLND